MNTIITFLKKIKIKNENLYNITYIVYLVMAIAKCVQWDSEKIVIVRKGLYKSYFRE